MLSLQDIQEILADQFFDGNTAIAGIVMYVAVMALVVVFFANKNITLAFGLMLPVTLIFTMLNVLPETLTIMLILVFVIGVAMKFRDANTQG